MPLPPALAARLAKRGIIKDEPVKPSKPGTAGEVEEVFAEDYDDPSKLEVTEPETKMEEEEKEESDKEEDTEYVHDVIDCPNKSNPFHTCVKYCVNRWGMRTFTPDPGMLRKRDRMIRKYPLPDGWKEVADPETGRYYYWSLQTEQVSWLSPAHPRAIISMPADKLRESLVSALDEDLEEDEDMENMEDEPMDAESDMSDSLSDSGSDEEDRRRSRREAERMKRERDARENRGRGFREERDKHRGHGRRDDIDPMDPAAYSDVPRGGWTEGLDTRGSAKTGVDVTASGPLFQQRPYPSPGDILRANQQLKKKS